MTTRTFRLVVAAQVALALVLGTIRLGHRSLWLDEAVSVLDARLPWPDFVDRVTGREANMSLYYLVLRGWREVVGSPAGLRFLSVLAGAGAVVFVTAVASRLAGRRVAVIAGLLLVVNPMFVHYAQEIRGYELSLLFASASTYLFVRGIQQPTALAWAGWAVVSAAAGYTHYFAGLVVLAQLVSLVARPRRDVPTRLLGRAFAAYAALSLPLAVFSRRGGATGLDWIKATNIGTAVDRARSVVPRPVGAVLAIVAVAAAVALARRVRARPPWAATLVVAWLVVPVVVAVTASYLVRPMFVGRYLIVALPAAAIGGAWLLAKLRSRAVTAAVLVILLTALAPRVIDRYRGDNSEDWTSAAAFVQRQVEAGDGIVFNGVNERILFEYYLTDATRRKATPLYPLVPWRSADIDIDAVFPPDPSSVIAAAEQHQRVWLVNNEPDTTVYPVLVEKLGQRYRAVDERRFTHLRVTRFERR
jgi:mannosyltransferase